MKFGRGRDCLGLGLGEAGEEGEEGEEEEDDDDALKRGSDASGGRAPLLPLLLADPPLLLRVASSHRAASAWKERATPRPTHDVARVICLVSLFVFMILLALPASRCMMM